MPVHRSDRRLDEPALPRVPMALLRLLLPRAERDEVLADLRAEYVELAAEHGLDAARRWLWRQALGSAPALLGWNWWRGWTGFEPRANAYRPGGPMLKSWITDARYAVRRLRARPTYTILSVLTLALGIGGTAAVFGVARPLLFDPLPYAHESEVVTFWMPHWWTEQEYTYLRDKYTGFRDVAMEEPGDVTMQSSDGPTRLLPGRVVSANMFDVLGARPLLGRGFREGEDLQGAEPVVVLSYGLWKELGGSESIIGQRLTLDGTPRTIVGVMPKAFWFPDPETRIWLTKAINPEGRNGNWQFFGRVAPGVDPHRMQPYVDHLMSVLKDRFQYSTKGDKTHDGSFIPVRETLLGSMRPAIVATFAAMGLILLIACANVAALMLGQVEGRNTELAVRSALGASRGRLTQQIVVEALLIGLGSALVGAVLAAAGFRLLATSLPLGAWGESATFDWTMFAVALVIALSAVLLVVLVPAASLWRGELRGTINSARMGGIQGRGGRLEQGLVVLQVALAMLVVSGAALLVHSVTKLYAIEPGVDTKGIAVMDVLSSRGITSAMRRQKLDEVTAALAALPGVKSAAATAKLPLRGSGNSTGITIEGRESQERTLTYFRVVTNDYFTTMGIRLRSGRTFDGSDRMRDSGGVVVINEALAKKYFPGENPIGRRVGGAFSGSWQIIGVVADVAEADLTDDAEPTRYFSAEQTNWFNSAATLVVRSASDGDAAVMLDQIRQTVNRVAPDFAVQQSTTMSRVLDLAVGPARQIMTLLTLLSALALTLGAVGIYGVIAHFAARRKRDWAIRVALGLPTSRVMRSIVGQGAALVAVGVVVGVLGAVALTRLLASFLYEVGRLDPLAFVAASVLLLLIGIVAAFVPARRASMVDPALVLREQ
jgi:predicted permease